MSAAYIREYYRVPAKRGGRIRYRGTGYSRPVEGTIVTLQPRKADRG